MAKQDAATVNAVGTTASAASDLNFTTADIKGMSLSSAGALVINKLDGEIVTIENFRDLSQQGAKLMLSDGQTIDTQKLFETLTATGPLAATANTFSAPEAVVTANAASSQDAITIGLPHNGEVTRVMLQPGQAYVLGFAPEAGTTSLEGGNLVITFADGSQLILVGYEQAVGGENPPSMTLANGVVVDGIALLDNARMGEEGTDQAIVEPANGAPIEQEMAQVAEELAAVEPAAGEAGGSAGSRGGFGFQSAVDAAPLNAPAPVGPLGLTELSFGAPTFDYLPAATRDVAAPVPPVGPPTVTVTPPEDPNGIWTGVGADEVWVKEDGSVFVNIVGTLGANASPNEILTVTVTGVQPGWTVTDTAGHGWTYDAATNTWSITMPAGQNYTGGLTFKPPADSDGDLTGLVAHANAYNPTTGETATAADPFAIYTDAVADAPNLTAINTSGSDNAPIALDIATSVNDTDGSESITSVVISGVPADASLSAGTKLSNGDYLLTQQELAGLKLTPARGFDGEIKLTITSTVTESTLSGREHDLTDNTATKTVQLSVIVHDDVPKDFNTPGATVDETSLHTSNPVVVNGTITANFGSDAAGSSFGATTIGDFTSSVPLTSGGHPVTVTLVGNTYVGTSEGQPIFTLQIGADGNYSFNLTGVLDHPIAGNPNESIALEFGVKATDGDGDSVSGKVTINVLDDAPTANNDYNQFNFESGSTTGNVITGVNGGPGAADLGSKDTPNNITSVKFGGIDHPVPQDGSAAVIKGEHGTLTIKADGSYTYVLDTVAPPAKDYNIVLMLDTSGSMGPNVDGTRMHALIESVKNLVADFDGYTGGTVKLHLVPFGSDVNNVATFNLSSDTLAQVYAYLDGLTSSGQTNYEAALQNAIQWLTANPGAENLSYFISDGAPNAFLSNSGAPVEVYNDGTPVSTAHALDEIRGDVQGGQPDNTNEIKDLNDLSKVISVGIGVDGTALAILDEISKGNTLNITNPDDLSGALTGSNPIGNPGPIRDEFEYTLTDADGDPAKAILVVTTEPPVAFVPTISVNNGVDDVVVKEDGSVFVKIVAALDPNGPAGQVLTVKVTGVDPSWTIENADGTYDAATGTWTITLPPNTNYNGGLTFKPPANSDVDLSGLNAVATAKVPSTGHTASATDGFNIITDAVADKPHVDAPDNAGVKNTALDVNITAGLTDNDGSETITHYQISGVPNGLTFNHGINLGNGIWQFTPADIVGLKATPPANYHGSIPLNVTVFSGETTLSGREVDTSDNTNSATDPFTLTWTPAITPPDVNVNNGIDDAVVKEDGSVTIPVTAVLGAGAETGEYLTVTITGINPAWGFSAPIGTYDATTGTWTVQLPPNTNLNTGLTFTPPANSDVDLSGLKATVVATQPSSGLTSSDTDGFNIITDAVADKPHVDAPDNSGVKNAVLDVHITAGLTDNDGSETITHYQISGVPAGFSFNHGIDLGNGVWQFTPAEIAGLKATAPANYHGSVPLNVTVFSGETALSDREVDTSDNTNSATDPFTLTWTPSITPPDVNVNNGIDDAQVKEDGSVTIPVTAVLGAGAEAGEYLTVTITGINPAWGFSAPTGTYNSATGTWTVTLPANTNLNTALTFTPPANSDVDLSGLKATVVATQPSSGLTSSDTDGFGIVVDAVADKPTIDAADVTANEGHPVAINVTAGLTDNDGSETITGYTISGVPAGFNFNQGTSVGGGVWTFTPAQLTGLTLTPPAAYNGNVALTVTVHNAEGVTDGEFDLSDNTNSASDQINLTWQPNANPPTVTVTPPEDPNGIWTGVGADEVWVKEDGSVFVNIVGKLDANAAPNEVLTVTVTGVKDGWVVTDTAHHGWVNQGNGTWSITMPAGQNYTGGLTFTPPANSDRDLTGLVATADAYQPTTNTHATAQDPFAIYTDAVADAPNLTASNTSGSDNAPIALTIATSVNDTDGSETITKVVISGVPADATLSAGTKVGSDWVLTPNQLAGLKLTPARGFDGEIKLTVTSTVQESNLSGKEHDLTDNTATKTVQLSVVVHDDTPTAFNAPGQTVDETNLNGGPVTVTNTLTANFGSDAAGSSFGLTGGFTSAVPLTSNGQPVSVVLNGNTYVATAGGKQIFTLTLGADGKYTFSLTGVLDHPNKADHNDAIALNFGVRATDGDGDTVTSNVVINVLDDGVNAVNDVFALDGGIGTVAGNVLSNDDLSNDTPNTVSKVTFNGADHELSGGSATIVGTHGTLVIQSNGDYTYTLKPGATASDGFTYTLRDGDGDTDTANLNFNLNKPTLIVGENVNDVPGSTTPYEVGTGAGTITGGLASDILIGDVGGSTATSAPKNYSVVMILDVSDSMGTNKAGDRLHDMIQAVKNLMTDFNVYEGGSVKVHFVPFGTAVGTEATFTLTAASLAAITTYLEGLGQGGQTNYEAALQSAIAWLQTEKAADPAAERLSYFISDGAPNNFQSNSGQAVYTSNVNQALDEIRGDAQYSGNPSQNDNTNEIAILKGLSNVIGVGIGVDNQALNIIKEIDSDGNALNIHSAAELSAALQGGVPVDKLLGVGSDRLVGGDGNDIIFGDSVNTDQLAASLNLNLPKGSGWEVFNHLETVGGWTRAQTLDYIKAHAVELAAESHNADGSGRTGGNDIIYGGAGNDLIFGQEGNDHIYGGAGDDILYGGSGADTFHYVGNDGHDTIKDFNTQEGDVLDLSQLLSGLGYDPTTDAINKFVFATEVGGNTVIAFDATGTGNVANAQALVTLENVHSTLDQLIQQGHLTTV